MDMQTITFADQEIANRLPTRKHFLKDIALLMGAIVFNLKHSLKILRA